MHGSSQGWIYGQAYRSEGDDVRFAGAKLGTPALPPLGIQIVDKFYVRHGTTVMNVEMLQASLIGVGTVLRLENDACSWPDDSGKRQMSRYVPRPPLNPHPPLPASHPRPPTPRPPPPSSRPPPRQTLPIHGKGEMGALSTVFVFAHPSL